MPGQNPYLGLLNISNVPQWNWDKLTLRSNAKYPPQMMNILHMFRWTESEPFKQDGSYSRLEWPIIICVRAIYKKFMHILQITDVLKSTTTITMLLMSRQPSCIYNIRDTWTSICQHNENDVKQNWGIVGNPMESEESLCRVFKVTYLIASSMQLIMISNHPYSTSDVLCHKVPFWVLFFLYTIGSANVYKLCYLNCTTMESRS